MMRTGFIRRNPMPTLLFGALSAFFSNADSLRGQCLTSRLLDGEGIAGDAFGYAVAISGDTAVIGAIVADTTAGVDAGAAHVYVRVDGTWVHQADLTPSDGAAGDQFGYSVAIDGDTVVVGADWVDLPGKTNCGAAYVFVRDGDTWTQQQKLIAADGASSDFLGVSAAISGNTIVVGAPGDDTAAGNNAGSAYVFTRDANGVWTQLQKLVASDGASGDFFSGYSVAIDGDTLVVGAIYDNHPGATDAGSAYVFTRNLAGVWTQQQKLLASPFAAFDFFGASVSLSGDTIIAVADGVDTAGADAGSAYVFVRNGTNWTQQAQLFASDAAAGDHFGWWAAVSGDRAVVGAPADPNAGGGLKSGSAYVFQRSGVVWTEKVHLVPRDGAPGDDFGACVAISGSTVFIGADYDDTAAAPNAGSVYVYDLGCTPGDLNCDDAVDPTDLPHFIEALLNTGNFAGCDINRADMNSDGLIDGRDVQPFVLAAL